MADDRDELLVRKFFEDNAVEVPDDGFTRRVMRRLPDRERRLSRIWAAVCAVAGVLMLLKFNWLGVLVSVLVSYIGSLVKGIGLPSDDIGSYALALVSVLFLIFLGGYKVLSEE